MADYSVSFYGPMTDGARQALDEAGLRLGTTRFGSTGADGGELPGERHSVSPVSASSKDDAVAAVQALLADRGTFGNFSAEPMAA